MNLEAEYDLDFYGWINKNVELLRCGSLSEIDAEHIAQELESMGKRDRRQLRSRLQVLIMHLLKWQYQPDKQSKSWLATIDHQRDEIQALLLDSPSLRRDLDTALVTVYAKAVSDTQEETSLPATAFPLSCPFALEEILSARFLPKVN
jgi:hypothetical protein